MPDHPHSAETIFYEALDLEPSDRESFARQRCGDDQALLDEVLSLLAAHERSQGFLDQAAVGAVAKIVEAEDPAIGATFGAFTVIERIAGGGMGQVYLAERRDGEFTQRAAVKVLHRGYGDEALRRFRNECQALARLEHPNIARMIDGGFTSSGTPFIIMEYVDGLPIDEYCDTHELSVEERLDLFRKVCDGLEHAHRHSTIHRDLKPGNVLVDREGVVKIVDFGIARVLDAADSIDQDRTATGMQMMTPLYASPEQLRGELLSTATDVYSLGVLLYRLLTGRAPYLVHKGSAQEMMRILETTAPTKPSELVLHGDTTTARIGDTRRVARRLRGDLDTIVLMAMRKEPERRYASVAQLSEDILNFLRGRPVLAQPDTFGYRARKFLRRNSVAVAATALVALVLVVSSLVSFRLYRQAEEQRSQAVAARDLAVENQETAEAVTTFLTDVFDEANPTKTVEQQLSARDLIDRGTARIRNDDEQDPAIRARILKSLGDVYASVGEPDSARALLEEAVRIEREVHGDTHQNLASALRAYGDLLADEGDHAGALNLHLEALEIMKRLYGPSDRRLPPFMNRIALNNPSMPIDEKIAMFRRSLAITEENFGPDDPQVAYYLINLGGALRGAGRYEEALEVLQRSVDIREAGLGPDHPLLGLSLGSLGATLIQLGRYEEAIPIEKRALAIKEKVYGPDHMSVSMTLNGLANAYMGLHRYADARPLYQRAIDMKTRLYGADHPFNGYDECSLALSYTRGGEPEEGLRHAQRAREILEKAYGADNLRVAYAWDALGESHAAQGDHDHAIADYETALRLRDSMGEHPVVGETLELYAKSLRAVGRDEDAGEAEARARAIRNPEAGEGH